MYVICYRSASFSGRFKFCERTPGTYYVRCLGPRTMVAKRKISAFARGRTRALHSIASLTIAAKLPRLMNGYKYFSLYRCQFSGVFCVYRLKKFIFIHLNFLPDYRPSHLHPHYTCCMHIGPANKFRFQFFITHLICALLSFTYTEIW
jgi:hypothetical protein